MTDAKCYQATPHGTLLEQIMDSTQPKNEREWAAMREIERNRLAIAELVEVLKAAVDCGMVPVSSALDGGAVSYSIQVQVADMIRAAIAKHDTSTTTTKEGSK